MAERENNWSCRLKGVEIEHVSKLRILVTHQQVLPVEGDRHLGGGVAGAQRRDEVEVGRVVDQKLILILAQDIDTVALRIGAAGMFTAKADRSSYVNVVVPSRNAAGSIVIWSFAGVTPDCGEIVTPA